MPIGVYHPPLINFTVLEGDEVEVVWANKQPFIATSYSIEAS